MQKSKKLLQHNFIKKWITIKQVKFIKKIIVIFKKLKKILLLKLKIINKKFN